MSYIHINTLEYPLDAQAVSLRTPNVSWPADIAAFEASLGAHGFAVVVKAPRPVVDHTKTVTEGAPLQTEYGYEQHWITRAATAAEIEDRTADAASAIRAERNQRLSDCDWTQIPDAAGAAVDVPAWTEYRKQLRAIPQQPGFPWDVQWPSEPSAPTGPILDYEALFTMLVGSSVYAAIRAKAATDPAVLIPCIELLNALGDARTGRPNPALIQAGLSALVTAANFSSEETAAFQALLDGLGFSAVYSLS